LDAGAYQIAKREISAMASALGMAVDMLIKRFDEWLFTLNVPDAPTDPHCHWREVHSISPDWTELARISLRYASIGTNEASVERLIGEQKPIQGPHGVNYGTETPHAHLVLRHEKKHNKNR
jgi:hypothetical protein